MEKFFKIFLQEEDELEKEIDQTDQVPPEDPLETPEDFFEEEFSEEEWLEEDEE
ncbi:hypothetical protein J7J41_02445 [bacterium]|nr:hypothetical protein [bacterium]